MLVALDRQTEIERVVECERQRQRQRQRERERERERQRQKISLVVNPFSQETKRVSRAGI